MRVAIEKLARKECANSTRYLNDERQCFVTYKGKVYWCWVKASRRAWNLITFEEVKGEAVK